MTSTVAPTESSAASGEPVTPDRYGIVPSPVGNLTITGTPDVLSGCFFEQHTKPVDDLADLERDDDAFVGAAEQLADYFAGERRTFDLALAPRGTDFQLRVWMALRAIPYGETRSYGELAIAVGSPKGSRAVGLANGRNPFSIIVPCHRVIGADGSLTGFGGGVDRKRFLLDLEQGTSALL